MHSVDFIALSATPFGAICLRGHALLGTSRGYGLSPIPAYRALHPAYIALDQLYAI